jgi:hypothetical protein
MDNWLELYILGCVAAAVVCIFNWILLWSMRWLSKTSIFLRNMKKIQPPSEVSVVARTLSGVGAVLFEIAFSWISVLVGIIGFFRTVFVGLREVFTSVPEGIRALRFPLFNNPHMSPEAVWAHAVAIAVLAGEPVSDASQLLAMLADVMSERSGFGACRALSILASLGVVDPKIIDEASRQFAAEAASLPSMGYAS